MKRPFNKSTPPQAGTLGPDGIEVRSRSLQISGGVCASFAIVGYPAEVGPGWLEPLLTYPGRLDVAVHVEPMPPQVAANRLKKQISRLESGLRTDTEHGRLEDIESATAADDAHVLAARLARGEGRLFRVGLYLSVHARDDDTLEGEVSQVRTLAASLLLDAVPTTFRALQGWTATLPLAVDPIELRRTFDTAALASAFPFTSPDLDVPITETSVLYGLNTATSSLVLWDRFACDNYNSVVLARSGAGKSYLIKLEVKRSLCCGTEVAVIDPEDEYRRLAQALDGAHIDLGSPGVRFNPFDLPTTRNVPDALNRRALFLHTLISVMAGQSLDPIARAALDRAIISTYNSAGITSDPRTWTRPAPLMADLETALRADEDPAAQELAAHLAPYVTGSHRALFSGPTTTRPDAPLIVFGLRHLPDELKPVGVLLTLDAIWRRISDPTDRRRRLVVVDEAWLLMAESEGARFLARLAKSARKHWTGLTVVTQDVADLLGSDLGQAVVSNAATQILLGQSPQAVDRVTEAFGLSRGEREFLLTCERGEGLLLAGDQRVGFRAIASPQDDLQATTDPAELADLEEDIL